MANVRDSDTSLWLHNKLGVSNDSWTGGSICSQLNGEVLRNIKDCFPDLQTQVKLKLLLSFFHIPRRNVEEILNETNEELATLHSANCNKPTHCMLTMSVTLTPITSLPVLPYITLHCDTHCRVLAKWCAELEEILEVAQVDSEQWVVMLAEIMKTLPSTGSLNTDISDVDENRRIFSDLVNDLRKLVKKQAELGMLPLECLYLNKSALVSVVGQQAAPTKHFTLKRKPKSAALRAELMQKSVDAQNNMKKSTTPTVPVRSRGMPRKMTDTTPLKGIPSRVPAGGFRSTPLGGAGLARPPLPRTPAGRKDGGIKLLDINEQPLGYAQAKKRKRMLELEEAKKASEASAQQLPGGSALPGTSTAAGQSPAAGQQPAQTPSTSATPDYAAGLTALNPPTPAPPPVPLYSPSPAPPTPRDSTGPATPGPSTSTATTSPAVPTAPSLQPEPVPALAAIASTSKAAASYTPQTASAQAPAATAATPAATAATPATAAASLTKPVMAGALPTPLKSGTVTKQVVQIRPTQIRIQPSGSAPAAGGTLQRKGLSLTREQMLEAQEMFRTANKVTRPEKALILGFMAGSRDNPCPHLGNIVTIKLSEDQETATQSDSTLLAVTVETHFQMNYNTGEWKKIKKIRKLEDAAAIAAAAANAVASTSGASTSSAGTSAAVTPAPTAVPAPTQNPLLIQRIQVNK